MPCGSFREAIVFFMIKSFRNAASRSAWERRFVKSIPNDIVRVAYRKLLQLHNARTLDDMRIPPGNRPEALSENRQGQYSVRINDQWRVCFVWEAGDAFEVEIADYH